MFSSTVQYQAFLLLQLCNCVQVVCFLLISQTGNCAIGVFRKNLLSKSYVNYFVYIFVVFAAADDGGGDVCLQCHLASDKPTPLNLTTICVCLK